MITRMNNSFFIENKLSSDLLQERLTVLKCDIVSPTHVAIYFSDYVCLSLPSLCYSKNLSNCSVQMSMLQKKSTNPCQIISSKKRCLVFKALLFFRFFLAEISNSQSTFSHGSPARTKKYFESILAENSAQGQHGRTKV